MPYYNAKFAAATALLLTILIPVYWLSQFGVFFEKLLWPNTENVFYWRELFTVFMQILIIVTLLNLRASLASRGMRLLRAMILGCVAVVIIFSISWLWISNMFDARSVLGVYSTIVQLLLLISLITLGAALQFAWPQLPANLRLAGLFLLLSVVLPVVSLSALVPIIPITLTISCGLIAVYFYHANNPIEVV